MFDRSFLPEATLEFVVLADTHYMFVDEDEAVEFPSRRRQTARSDRAVALINALDPSFVVHMGDKSQAYPGSDGFDEAVRAAEERLDRLEPERYQVAGNHDVGDKPDPTMPADRVTADSLRAYGERNGRSWYGWRAGGRRFLVLDSQLMNTSLPEAAEQRAWLESELRDCADEGEEVVVFTHLSPYLHDPDEPGLGHYDNVDEPARGWLLDLLREHAVDHLFAAHSHFCFRNRLGETTLQVVPSPAFTRPGFGELFASCPPPERGRDDRGKLGFYLVRVVDGDLRVHFLRTGGETSTPDPDAADRLVSRTSPDLPGSPLGASLVHPLTHAAEVPSVFPSSIRQTVHDDYPLLSCLGAGLSVVRTSVSDAASGLVSRKLADLGGEGVTVVGTVLTDGRESVDAGSLPEAVDDLEVATAGRVRPGDAVLDRVREWREAVPGSLCLSTTVPGRTVETKQHSRLRSGFDPSEVAAVDAVLDRDGTDVDRLLCAVGDADPWETMTGAPDPEALTRIGALDWRVATTDLDEAAARTRVARATFAAAVSPGSRLYVEPLRELDRTMDAAPGLIDRRRNPTSLFETVRCLNAVLFGEGRRWEPAPAAGGHLRLESEGAAVALVADGPPTAGGADALDGGDPAAVGVVDLASGTVVDGDGDATASREERAGPLLVVRR